MRRTALLGGAFYLHTFAASIPALVLKGPVLHDLEYVPGSEPVIGVLLAGLLDVRGDLATVAEPRGTGS